jgi:hypothetical protein
MKKEIELSINYLSNYIKKYNYFIISCKNEINIKLHFNWNNKKIFIFNTK